MPFLKKKVASRTVNPAEPETLIWRVPNEAFPKVKAIDEIIVKEFEKAVFVKNGAFQNVLSSGKHPVPKDIDEIVWVDVSPKTQPFGIPVFNGPITQDNFQIGLSGTLAFRVAFTKEDVKAFLLEMVGGNRSFDAVQVVDWLRKGPLASVLRDILKNRTLDEFRRLDRENFVNLDLRPRLVYELSKFGIELISMDVTGMTWQNLNSR